MWSASQQPAARHVDPRVVVELTPLGDRVGIDRRCVGRHAARLGVTRARIGAGACSRDPHARLHVSLIFSGDVDGAPMIVTGHDFRRMTDEMQADRSHGHGRGAARCGLAARDDERCVGDGRHEAAPARCVTAIDDAWPAWTNGRPANVDPKTAAGVYMWHDGTGWHIRVTHRGVARRTFSGELVTTGRFVGVSSVRLEGHDSRSVSPDHHTITFRFENHGAIDGLNFRTHCAPSIAFTFVSDGAVDAGEQGDDRARRHESGRRTRSRSPAA